MENIFIVSGKRIPFGAFGGSLKDVSATDLAVQASIATLKSVNYEAKDLDHIVFGSVVQSAHDAIYLPRHVGLKAGSSQCTPALGINRLCGTGFEVIASAARLIQTGEAESVLAGGTEQMSQIPYVVRGARWGQRMGHGDVEDVLMSALTDSFTGLPMAITAENLAEQYGLSREQVDEYAYESQQRCARAIKENIFDLELTDVTVKTRKSEVVFSKDEHPKSETTLEKLQTLRPVFQKDGVVTAGNASGIVDGAASALVMSEKAMCKQGFKPLARIVGWASVGCDPKIMGIGPVGAIRDVLKKTNLSLEQIDLVEVNEAFSAQYLAVEKELNLPRERTNINGGAIAIGHPLAATGTRIMNHLVHQLNHKKLKYGLGSACIGGGQGIAMIVERGT